MVSLPPTAQSGRISPTGRRGSDNNDSHPNIAARTRLEQANRSTWHRYSEHHRCHPKNVCSGCCYRPRTLDEWSGDRWVELVAWEPAVAIEICLQYSRDAAQCVCVCVCVCVCGVLRALALILFLALMYWLLIRFSVSLLICYHLK